MLKRVLFLAAVAVASVSGSARADFVIDSFSTPGSAQQYSLAGGVPSTFTVSGLLDANTTRTITVTQTANLTGAAGQTSGQYGGGLFTFGLNPGARGFASLLYTYGTAVDLSSGGSAITFTLNSADQDTPITVRISDGTNTASQTTVVANPDNAFLSLPLSGFAGINAGTVQSVELLLNYDANGQPIDEEIDLILSEVAAANPPGTPPAVPAPVGLVLLLAAAPALGLARRFARKA